MATIGGARALHLEKPLSSTLVFDYPTLDALAQHLENDVLQFGTVPEVTDAPAAAEEARFNEIEQLSDAEVEALLMKKVKTH